MFKTQSWGKKRISSHYTILLIKLLPCRNDSKCDWELSLCVCACVCVCVCVSIRLGGCTDRLRLHSSVCIRSRRNEAESLAVVRRICSAAEWWASHSAAVPRGCSHIWGRCLPLAWWLCAPGVFMLQKVMPHMLRLPSGRSACLQRLTLAVLWLVMQQADRVTLNCQIFIYWFVLFPKCAPSHGLQYKKLKWFQRNCRLCYHIALETKTVTKIFVLVNAIKTNAYLSCKTLWFWLKSTR